MTSLLPINRSGIRNLLLHPVGFTGSEGIIEQLAAIPTLTALQP